MNWYETGKNAYMKILIQDLARWEGAKRFKLGRQRNPIALDEQIPLAFVQLGGPGRQEPHGHSPRSPTRDLSGNPQWP
jgi:hypothetical protein